MRNAGGRRSDRRRVPNQPSVDDELQKLIDQMRASIAQTRKMAAALPPADAANLLKAAEEPNADLAGVAR